MTTSQKLWLGFGTLTALLVLLGVTIIVPLNSIESNVQAQADVARPRVSTARELAINVLRYALAVHGYLLEGNPTAKKEAEEHANGVAREQDKYQRLATTDWQRESATRFAVRWKEIYELGQTMLNAENRQPKQDDVTRFTELRIRLEKFLDAEMQVDALNVFHAGQDAILQDVQTIGHFALSVLLVSVIIAVLTSVAVGRGVIRAERTVRESEQRFQEIAHSVDAVFYVADMPERRFRYISPAFQRLWGLPADELYQDLPSWLKRIHSDDLPVTMDAFEAFLAGEQPYDVEYRIRFSGGVERWVRDRATVAARDRWGKISRITGLAEDITERKRAEQKLAEADRRKDVFLATLAHELRNPLAPICNAVQALSLQGSQKPELRAALDIIDRQLHQMVRLIDDLLDVTRITTGKLRLRKQRVALAEVLEQALEASRPGIESAGHQLSVSLPPQPIYLDADPVRLSQVFSNILNNACKYTEEGGHIWLTAERDGTAVVVRVKDDGIGIGREHLPHLFDMFSQSEPMLERSHGGLGIGLSLARSLVELHDGDVQAHSEGLGKGSEFIVQLPLLEESLEAQPPNTENRAGHEASSARHILVVDDNQDSVESLATLLRLAGNVVHTAHDGIQAVDATQRYHPDVVLLDIGMPRLNGYDAARQIRELPGGKSITLVALTGWGQEEDKRRSQEAGFDHHITKPVDSTALQNLFARLKSTSI